MEHLSNMAETNMVLPNEIIFDIGLRLNMKDVCSYCVVSKIFREVVNDSQYFWNKKLYHDFGIGNTSNDSKNQYIQMFDTFNLTSSAGLAAAIGNVNMLYYIIRLGKIRCKRIDVDVAMKAAIYNNKNLIDIIISLGFNDWNKGLKYAAKSGNVHLVNFFISKGARDMNKGLMGAVKSNSKELIQFFICRGADDWNMAMIKAAKNCHVDLVYHFFYKVWNDWESGLMYACKAKEETYGMELVKYFIGRGARNFTRAMGIASKMGYEKVVKILISKGAYDWNSGLVAAAEGNCLNLVKYFIGRGAHNLQSALVSSSKGGYADIVKFLLLNGALVKDQDLVGPSRNGHTEVVEELIERLKYTQNFNKTINMVLKLVMREKGNKYRQIREILLKNGAIED